MFTNILLKMCKIFTASKQTNLHEYKIQVSVCVQKIIKTGPLHTSCILLYSIFLAIEDDLECS